MKGRATINPTVWDTAPEIVWVTAPHICYVVLHTCYIVYSNTS